MVAARMDIETPAPDDCSDRPAAPRDAAAGLVLELYRTLLKRDPGGPERDSWIDALLNGLSPDAARTAFLQSPEYQHVQRAAASEARIAATGLFDPAWYLAHYKDVAAAGFDPLRHYAGPGRQEHRAPNPYFAPRWYRRRAGIADATDALLDYAERGEAAGLPPGPLFDPAWYRSAYPLGPGVSPLAHFLRHRFTPGVAPCARLWSVAHRPIPAEPGEDPFLPWLDSPADPAGQAAADIAELAGAGVFDANYYQIINHDVFDSGIDPLMHYCGFGWREGRNPSFYFNAAWYLATNPDAERLGVNSLVHYLLVGEAADRRPVVYFEPGWYRHTYGVPDGMSALAHFLAHRHSGAVSPNALFDPAWYRAHCGRALHHRRDLFAHYLLAGMRADLAPSPLFDPAEWRARSRGRRTRHFTQTLTPERDNPLIDYMLTQYS